MFVETKRSGEQQTSDPLKLGTLIAWLEKQPADESYHYNNGDACLLAQYLSQHYDRRVFVGGCHFFIGEDAFPLPEFFSPIAQKHERTFGAALERARACKA